MDLIPAAGLKRWHLLRQALEKAALDEASKADVHVVGIGGLSPLGTSTFGTHIRELRAEKALSSEGMVGEIGFLPFNAEGGTLHDQVFYGVPEEKAWKSLTHKRAPLARFFESTFTMDWKKIKPSPRTILVGGGREKHEAIKVALTKLAIRKNERLERFRVDRLVTDSETAEYLYSCAVSGAN